MAAAQLLLHQAYDRNRVNVSFSVGGDVLLGTRHLDLAHLGTEVKRKIVLRFICPYPVENITGQDTYTLGLPLGLRLHPEYHVSRLRRYCRDDSPTRITRFSPVIVADGSEGHLVPAIIGHRKQHGAR